jgi:hypothetical protein
MAGMDGIITLTDANTTGSLDTNPIKKPRPLGFRESRRV